jgi:3-oxoacyl-[acyl-carrier protein] reductase
METGLKDRIVIVAAASQGLGRATAEAFAAEGAKLAICSRSAEKIKAAAGQIRARHQVDVLAESVDVTNAEAVARFVDAVAQKFGRIDVCVTNAGGPPAGTFSKLSLDDFRRAVELNFLSVVYFAHAVIPHMQRHHWGRLITITSLSVKQPIPDLVLSNSVRAAVVGLVKSLANEYGREGILVNNVGPGFTATDRLKELAAARAKAGGTTEQQIFEGWATSTAVGRVAEPREVADTIVWLASERASAITGQTILVDGGSYKGLM